jgi:linoleoyl-CoA desaturase
MNIPARFEIAKPAPFYRALRQEVALYLKRQPRGRFASSGTWLKGIVHAALFAMCYATLFFSNVVPGPLLFLCAIGCGFFGLALALAVYHDAAHGVFVRSVSGNKALAWITLLPVGIDVSFTAVIHKQSHHAFPNVEGCDVDVEANPLIRFSPHHPFHSWNRWQVYYAIPAYMFYILSQVFVQDFVLLKGELQRRCYSKGPSWLVITRFAFFKFAYIALVVLPMIAIESPLWGLLLGYFLATATQSLVFTLCLAGVHLSRDVAFPAMRDGVVPGDRASLAVATSVDWAPTSALASFLFSGANAHAIHHLLPDVSHAHYRALTPIVKKALSEHNVTYNCKSFVDVVKSHFGLLTDLSRPTEAHGFGLGEARSLSG